jgi:RimJ/RimL family protein N-acetyltransferase
MAIASPNALRLGRVSDFRALGRLYSRRDGEDRALFHPFPEGRLVAPIVFFALLASQPFRRLLLRWHPPWAFAFIIRPGSQRGTIDGFVYLRGRRRTSRGYVANIGSQVAPSARGQGLATLLKSALFEEARRMGIHRIETAVYEHNTASRRVNEKLGFRPSDDPTSGPRKTAHGVEHVFVLDLDEGPGPIQPERSIGRARPMGDE